MQVSIFAVAKLIILEAVLCTSEEASEQIALSQCPVNENHGPIRQCVVSDTTGDVYYEGEDITASITIDLPRTILLECMADLNRIAVVSPSGNVMVTGREIKSKQDKGRWFVEYTFQTDGNHGRLTITLHIKSVNWNDHQMLHVEIRGNDVTYKTSDWDWIIVTIGHPTTEDPQAMKQPTVEAPDNEKIALQKEIIKVQKDLIHCQAKDGGGSNNWDIATCLLVAIVVIAAIFFGFILRSYSLVSNRAISQVDPENIHEYEMLTKAC